mmetsp:Transcript_65618/g.169562  ORF Transcript_65618/g.169562 Transcript_65618/m.169562 type:complete len:219 (-) Transcript_65618:28-684(-)
MLGSCVDGRGRTSDAVHPARYPSHSQLLAQSVRVILAIVVNKVVVVPSPLPCHPSADVGDLLRPQLGDPKRHRSLVRVLRVCSRMDARNARPVFLREAVGPLAAVDLDARVEEAGDQHIVIACGERIDLSEGLAVAQVIHVAIHRACRELRSVKDLAWHLAMGVPVKEASQAARRSDGRRCVDLSLRRLARVHHRCASNPEVPHRTAVEQCASNQSPS